MTHHRRFTRVAVAIVLITSCNGRRDSETAVDPMDAGATPDAPAPEASDAADTVDVALTPAPMSFQPIASATSTTLTAVFVGRDGDVCVGGDFAGVRCRESGAWVDHSDGIAPFSVSGLWGDRSGLKLAGGQPGRVWSFDGSRWTLAAQMGSSCSVGPKVLGLSDGYAVASCPYYSGLMRLKVGDPNATELASGLLFQARDAFAFSPSEIFVLAHGVRRYRGGVWTDVTSWSAEPLPPAAAEAVLEGIWAWGDTGLVAVGQGGVVLTRKAGVWEEQDTGTKADLRDVWGSRGVGTYAVGNEGTLLFSDGKSWQRLPVPTTVDLWAVHGHEDGTVVVVGGGGTILRSVK